MPDYRFMLEDASTLDIRKVAQSICMEMARALDEDAHCPHCGHHSLAYGIGAPISRMMENIQETLKAYDQFRTEKIKILVNALSDEELNRPTPIFLPFKVWEDLRNARLEPPDTRSSIPDYQNLAFYREAIAIIYPQLRPEPPDTRSSPPAIPDAPSSHPEASESPSCSLPTESE